MAEVFDEKSVGQLTYFGIAGLTVLQEGVEGGWVFDAFDESLAEYGFQIPESLGVVYEFDVVSVEEILESLQVLYEFLIVEVSTEVEAEEIVGLSQHLHKLHILDELAVQLISFLKFHRLASPFVLIELGLHYLILAATVLLLKCLLRHVRHPFNLLFIKYSHTHKYFYEAISIWMEMWPLQIVEYWPDAASFLILTSL